MAKTVQDGAKMRPRREKLSPINVAIAGRFAAFAKNVLMKQVLDRGRTGRREKEPKCGHCRGQKRCGWPRWIPKWIPRGGQDGPRWGKMGQDAARTREMSPINVAIAGRFAVFAKVKQFRGKEGPIMYV